VLSDWARLVKAQKLVK